MIDHTSRIEQFLNEHLATTGSRLTEAMRYGTLNGGKRLRANLIYATGACFNLPCQSLDHAAAAIECIHAYSLIHDDLPAMDNDDLRRGKPSCHKVYGETEAILAGDALNTLAFELLSQSSYSAEIKIKQIIRLAQAAGYAGMVGGQSLDMLYTSKQTDQNTLETIHRGKTGALIACALHLGALPADNYLQYQHTLTTIGEKLGIAYQILDDILDTTASTATLGKTAGKDAQQAKTTYISLIGLEKSQEKLTQHHESILTLLTQLPNPTPLKTLIEKMQHREF